MVIKHTLSWIVVAGLLLTACAPLPPAPSATPTAAPTAEAAENARADAMAAAIDLAALKGPSEGGWIWQSYTPADGEPLVLDASVSYALNFLDESSLFVTSDCNFLTFPYVLDGAQLTIEPSPGEINQCAEGSHSEQFMALLQQAVSLALAENELTITTTQGALYFAAFDPLANFRVDSWNEAAQKFLAACDAPGAVLLVDSPEGRFLQAYGLASLEDKTPMQVDDRFEIGSNSKSFTAVLALQLQEEGVWSLADPLIQWLPDVAARIPHGDAITLRHLASNTSGVWDYANPLIGSSIENNTLEQGYTPQELIDYVVANGAPDFAPGQGGAYSSTNFVLLGMAIEAATGQSLADLYQRKIFAPLAMVDSALLEGVPAAGQIVDGYYTPPSGALMNTTRWNGSQGWAAGGIISTAADMAAYAKALDSGQLFHDPDSSAALIVWTPKSTQYWWSTYPALSGLRVGHRQIQR
ncbi:MAG: serine hydrolase [Caldilineaceae bacterium]|nr:serine hydrolase [Caldilineaceae bacterium]